MSLFDVNPPDRNPQSRSRPLADRMRPDRLDDFMGQEHILGKGKPLRQQIEHDRLASVILWGPPGVGKTTLARIIAASTRSEFIPFSAVLGGMKEIKAVMADAERLRHLGKRTILFIDEIHRFNKAQQDAFLPYVEHGDIILIGATTENPSFEVNAALLSRSKVYALQALSDEQIGKLLRRALADDERGLGNSRVTASEDLLHAIAAHAGGDARSAYNTLESVVAATPAGDALSEQAVAEAVQRKTLLYDKAGEEHFNIISALHKSVRSSDADAALYWLARMLEAGEDRMYVARRLVRMAVEDIGLADPRAIEQAMAVQQAVHFLGVPEGDLALGQLAIYLAVAPKSDASYRAMGAVRREIQETRAEPVPLHLRNAPTRFMKQWGYGAGYEHAHAFEDAITGMDCLPGALRGRRFYEPAGRGMEKRIGERMDEIARLREQARGDSSGGAEPEPDSGTE